MPPRAPKKKLGGAAPAPNPLRDGARHSPPESPLRDAEWNDQDGAVPANGGARTWGPAESARPVSAESAPAVAVPTPADAAPEAGNSVANADSAGPVGNVVSIRHGEAAADRPGSERIEQATSWAKSAESRPAEPAPAPAPANAVQPADHYRHQQASPIGTAGTAGASPAGNSVASLEYPADGGSGSAPIAHFAHRPDNLRDKKEYSLADKDLAAMQRSVEAVGILQPVTVCAVEEWIKHHPDHTFGPEVRWVVVLGNRRLASAKESGHNTLAFNRRDRLAIPLVAREAGLSENRHRKGSDPVLEGIEMKAIRAETGESQRDFADRLGFSHTHVQNREWLLSLIPQFQALVSDRTIKAEPAVKISKLSEEDQRKLLLLGPPYVAKRLTAPPAVEGGNSVATSRQLIIPKGATPTDIAKMLRALPPEILDRIRDELGEDSAMAV